MLLVAFGSVVAMGLPIVTALMGIFVGAAAVGVLSAFLDIPEFSLILCAMIGLGVGIDYALFIVTRHRQHLHEGMSVEDAAGTAVATAGQAVLFAGTTVVIAILGLFLAGLPAISGMGAAVALVVTVSMVAAITLLPGLLGLAGTKIDRLSIHRKSHVAKPADETVRRPLGPPRRQPPGPLRRRRPRRPVRHRHPGAQHAHRRPRRRQRPHRHDPAHRLRPAGRRLRTRVQRPDPGRRRAPAVRRPGDRRAGPRRAAGRPRRRRGHRARSLNAAGDTAVLTVNPTTAPQDERTDQLVRHLRADVLPPPSTGTDARVSLTGQAMVTDLTDRITNRLPLFIAAVVAMSFLLLMIVFRSILVPLKAALMNLLSIAAAYGVLVAVFQWGWGAALIGLHSTMPINPFLPLIMFAILFGLSMDYEVFLLSRIREEYVATGDNHEAVVRGLSEHRPGDHLGRADHDQRVRRLRPQRRPQRQAVRRRPRRRRAHRRHPRPHGAGAGDHEPARPGQLVAARLARPDPPPPRPRVRPDGARGQPRARARARRRLTTSSRLRSERPRAPYSRTNAARPRPERGLAAGA